MPTADGRRCATSCPLLNTAIEAGVRWWDWCWLGGATGSEQCIYMYVLMLGWYEGVGSLAPRRSDQPISKLDLVLKQCLIFSHTNCFNFYICDIFFIRHKACSLISLEQHARLVSPAFSKYMYMSIHPTPYPFKLLYKQLPHCVTNGSHFPPFRFTLTPRALPGTLYNVHCTTLTTVVQKLQ